MAITLAHIRRVFNENVTFAQENGLTEEFIAGDAFKAIPAQFTRRSKPYASARSAQQALTSATTRGSGTRCWGAVTEVLSAQLFVVAAKDAGKECTVSLVQQDTHDVLVESNAKELLLEAKSGRQFTLRPNGQPTRSKAVRGAQLHLSEAQLESDAIVIGALPDVSGKSALDTLYFVSEMAPLRGSWQESGQANKGSYVLRFYLDQHGKVTGNGPVSQLVAPLVVPSTKVIAAIQSLKSFRNF